MQYSKNLITSTINSIKILSALSVEAANSGHPGAALGLSDFTSILWQYFLKFNPKDPSWLGRDIFILSGGHVSVLQYSLLHLFHYDLSIDELKNFRQINSKTPGHTEYFHTPGVETTTGPLGQGFANAVGFAIARKKLTKISSLFDNKIYCVFGDGDLMEGITNEAISIAGHLKLSNLIAIYDSNKITIDGSTSFSISEDVVLKFKAANWDVIEIDAYDHSQIFGALNFKTSNKPYLIILNSIIGKDAGSKEGSEAAHGAPLGENAIKALKENLNWTYEDFNIPKEVYDYTFQKVIEMEKEYMNWNNSFKEKNLSDNILVKAFTNKDISKLYKELRDIAVNTKEATRKSSQKVLQIISKELPYFIGGSADLANSNLTSIKDEKSFLPSLNYEGRNIYFGIREHAMAGIANGIVLNGPFIPYVSTFLVFSDYMRASIRLSALMKQQVIYIFTHDSIFVGEDGPTHQPIEQLSSLRLIPDLNVIRPCNIQETVEAYLFALENKDKPTAIILSRQDIDLKLNIDQNIIAQGLRQGAYIIKKETKALKAVILATGSEVASALDLLNTLDIVDNVRLISVPILDLLDDSLISKLIPEEAKVIIIEAGTLRLWHIKNHSVLKIGIEGYGTSAKPMDVAKYKEFDLNSMVEKTKTFLNI